MSTTGIVFNIQRFSVHDGPGIRTTVFLKGCSLRCFWCHNPEGIQLQPEIQFFPARCIDCGECLVACPEGAHTLAGDSRVFGHELCQACGRCVEMCYAEALQLTGERMTVGEVIAEVLRDRVFYESSDGGITLSGGEPLVQRDFARAILARCQAEGLHTAVETAAHCRWEDLALLLPVTDLMMVDVKHMDPDKHRATTGVSNARILDNSCQLMQTDQTVLFRVPVVPTVNDTPEEIGAIAAFVRHLIDLRLDSHDGTSGPAALLALELLPFHRLAADKYRSLGLDYRASQLEGLSEEKMTELREAVRAHDVPIAGL